MLQQSLRGWKAPEFDDTEEGAERRLRERYLKRRARRQPWNIILLINSDDVGHRQSMMFGGTCNIERNHRFSPHYPW